MAGVQVISVDGAGSPLHFSIGETMGSEFAHDFALGTRAQ